MRAAAFVARVLDKGFSLSDAYDLVSHVAGIPYDRVKNTTHTLEISDTDANAVLARLESGEPVAYITRRREFFGIEFSVNENVLIPRVDTETLVECALGFIEGRKSPEILDICTGSGCILLSLLANNADARGTGVDISLAALSVAERNAAVLLLSGRCGFTNADAANYVPEKLYDIVTCNPPYISEEEYAHLEPQVLREPKLALVASDDGLFFYKKILSNIHLFCKKDGAIFFEIGYCQKSALREYAEQQGIAHLFIKDCSGNDRVFVCYPRV